MRNLKHQYPYYRSIPLPNFRALVEDAAVHYGDRDAFGYKLNPRDESYVMVSYNTVRDNVRDLATALIARGYRGKKVAIISDASYFRTATYYAVMAIGAVTVPIDKELPPADIAGIISTAECEGMFFAAAAQDKIEEVLAAAPCVKETFVLNECSKYPDVTSFSALIEEGAKRVSEGDTAYYDYEIDPDALASIVFTSGTTGKGKGVMLSTRNLCSDMEKGYYLFTVPERTLNVLPPHHTYGSTVLDIGHLGVGSCVYYSCGLKYILNELKQVKPTHLVLVPLFVETFYKRIWQTAEKQGKADLLRKMMKVSNGMRKVGIDLRRKLFQSVLSAFGGELELIICGGAALNQDIINTFEALGVTVLNGYGITECSPLISCNRNRWQKKGAVGLPLIDGEVRILNPDENGEGEIAYRGPNVMLGYFNQPEATAEVMTEDGFFRTGDLGKLDKDGFIYITGRAKNLIIFSNGKNVYPEEIEAEIQRIEGVSEVVVYAGESASQPEAELIVAEIYPDAELLAERGVTDLKTYFEQNMREVNARMVSYKKVHRIKLRDTEFEKNTSKKIVRFKIDKTVD